MITIELNQKLDENGIEILGINYETEYGDTIDSSSIRSFGCEDENGNLTYDLIIDNYEIQYMVSDFSIDNSGDITVITCDDYPFRSEVTHIQINSYDTTNNNEYVRATKWIPIQSLLSNYEEPIIFDDETNEVVLFEILASTPSPYCPIEIDYDDYGDDYEAYDNAIANNSYIDAEGSIQSMTNLPQISSYDMETEGVSVKMNFEGNLRTGNSEVIVETNEFGSFSHTFASADDAATITYEIVSPGAFGKTQVAGMGSSR